MHTHIHIGLLQDRLITGISDLTTENQH